MAEPPRQPEPPRPTPPRGGPDAHPCPRAAPPPSAEECGDRGAYKSNWWQGSMFSLWWQAALIAIAILTGLWLLRNVVGPMISSGGP